MKKKLVVLMMILSASFAYGEEEATMSKQVTGVNKQILESTKLTGEADKKDEVLDSVGQSIKNHEVKLSREKINVAKENQNNENLESELSQGMDSDKNIFMYILGAVLMIAGLVAL